MNDLSTKQILEELAKTLEDSSVEIDNILRKASNKALGGFKDFKRRMDLRTRTVDIIRKARIELQKQDNVEICIDVNKLIKYIAGLRERANSLEKMFTPQGDYKICIQASITFLLNKSLEN